MWQVRKASAGRLLVRDLLVDGRSEGDPNAGGNHRKSLQQNLHASLKRLNTDYIDLLWVHMDDGLTPLEETMRALDEVVRQGKALYVGISDMPAWRVARANTLAEWRGWSPFVGLQIEYNLTERTPERDLIPMARELGLGVMPWSPLAQGVLSGKYTEADLLTSSPITGGGGGGNGGTVEGRHERNKTNGRLNARTLAIAGEAKAIAGELGASTAQVALAWLLAQPGVVSPVIGARTAAQLQDSLGCFDVTLSLEHLARLDAVSKIELGFPHDFLRQETVQRFVRGGTTVVG